MKNLPSISDAEWSVMKILWKESPATFAEIAQELKSKQSWSPKTIQTLLQRLIKKGAVTAQKDTHNYSYSACVAEEELVGSEANSFVDRVFDGSVNALIAHFAKAKKFSQSEIDELKKILNRKD